MKNKKKISTGKKILYFILLLVAAIFIVRICNTLYYRNKTAKIITAPTYNENSIENVSIKRVESGSVNGYHFIPNKKLHKGIIIAFGGSEGGPEQWIGERYSKKGYEVLCLYYFGQKGLNKKLSEVPLEFFQEVTDYIGDDGPITVYGISKGAELALNLGTKYDSIDHLILNGPSAYVFPGIGKDLKTSSWSFNGKGLEIVDIPKESYLPAFNFFFNLLIKRPAGCIKSYEEILKHRKDINKGRIPAELIKDSVPVLIFAGTDDHMWTSKPMGEIIKEHKKNTELVLLKNAGHMFYLENPLVETNGMIFDGGGTLKDNKKGKEIFLREMDDHLNKWHPLLTQ